MAINQRDYLQTIVIQNMQQKARIELLNKMYEDDLERIMDEKFEADRILSNFNLYLNAKLEANEDITEEEFNQKENYEKMIASNQKLKLMYNEILEMIAEKNHTLHDNANYHMWMLASLELSSGYFTIPVISSKTEKEMKAITNGYECNAISEWVSPFSIPLSSFSHETQLEYAVKVV